jgi:hypothetical protein
MTSRQRKFARQRLPQLHMPDHNKVDDWLSNNTFTRANLLA